MANINITIKNLPEIRAAFKKAPGAMTRELNVAIKKSVLTIQSDSMRNTPVLTGRLRASHRTLFSDLKGSVFTDTNYDIFVHDGTRYMKARPYMKDAVQSDEQKVQEYMTKAVDNVLSEIARSV